MHWSEFIEKYDEWSESTLRKRVSQLEDFGSAHEVTEVANFIGYEDTNARFLKNALEAGVKFSMEDIKELDGVIDEEMTELLVNKLLSGGYKFTFEDMMHLDALIGEECLSKILKASVKKGTSLTPEQIMELDGLVDEDALTEAVKASKAHFSKEDIENLDGSVDYDLLLEMDRKQGTHVFPENEDYEDDFETDDEPFTDADKQPGGFFSKMAMAFGIGHGISQGIKDATAPKPRKFRAGDHVRVRYRGQEGTIVDINGDLYMVSLKDGGYVDSYTESQLEKAW